MTETEIQDEEAEFAAGIAAELDAEFGPDDVEIDMARLDAEEAETGELQNVT